MRTETPNLYNELIKKLAEVLNEDTATFAIPPSAYFDPYMGNHRECIVEVFKSCISQVIAYLEAVYQVGEEIVQVGSLYNSITDEALRNRCADLLSAPDHFDRVINQATQVLEDRIRRKAGHTGNQTGTQLTNIVLNPDLSRTILKFSDDSGEHAGHCDIVRGVMTAYRNPSHHHLSNNFTREDALKICAFIDNLLKLIDHAQVVRQS